MSDPNTGNFASLAEAELALAYKIPYCPLCAAKTRIYIEPVARMGTTGEPVDHYMAHCSKTRGLIATIAGDERDKLRHYHEDFGPVAEG